jgi:hypothetical protein
MASVDQYIKQSACWKKHYSFRNDQSKWIEEVLHDRNAMGKYGTTFICTNEDRQWSYILVPLGEIDNYEFKRITIDFCPFCGISMKKPSSGKPE